MQGVTEDLTISGEGVAVGGLAEDCIQKGGQGAEVELITAVTATSSVVSGEGAEVVVVGYGLPTDCSVVGGLRYRCLEGGEGQRCLEGREGQRQLLQREGQGELVYSCQKD